MKKTLSIFRWFGIMLVSLILLILAPFIYPIAYVLRKPVRKYKFVPLWIFLDDTEENDWGTDWFIKSKNLKLDTVFHRFWASYLWSAIRNPAWNQYSYLKPKQGVKSVLSSKGYITNSKDIYDFAVLKGLFKDGTYADNKGDFISLKHSKLGGNFTWYYIEKKLYFRASFAGFFIFTWLELQLGTNDSRYTFRLKFKKYENI